MAKLIIAGGRGFEDKDLMHETLRQFYGILFAEFVLGMCSTGADRLALEYAQSRGRKIHRFPADWEKNGKKAGPIRNEEMAKFADVLVAFWDGESKGTRDMINRALKYNCEVHVYRYKAKT